MTLSDVLADLAAGRIRESDAVDRLRDQIANGQASFELIVTLLRTQGQRLGLDATLGENLLQMLENTTRARATATLEPGAPASQTIRRDSLTSNPADALTRPRVPNFPDRADSIPAGSSPTRLRENSSLANDGSGTRMRTPSADPGVVLERAAPVSDPIGPRSILKGRFEIKALVGRGGMGTVFRAEDRRKLEARDPNPEVAVKILNASFEQHPDSFVALQREASKAQTLAHPNIATVFDFDRDGRNVFITMELLRGQTLESMLHAVRGRGVGRTAALPLIRGIAEGLAYAHRKGIVHSDLKPANIFVLEDGTPKILDFGIARAVPVEAKAAPRDEFDAVTLGAYSEGYATAEMIDGADPAPADDLYALGVIVYELLTGTHPFDGRNAVKANAAGKGPPPIRVLRRREWQTLARSLAFERSARPRDAAEFLRAFFGTTRLRNSLIAAIVLLAMTAGYLWYRNYQQTGPDVPFDQLPTATQQDVTTYIAEGNKEWNFYARQGIAEALDGSVTDFAKAYTLHKGNRAAAHGLERAADEIMKRVGDDPTVRHEAAQTLAEKSEYLKNYPPVRNELNR
jgi:serine/threonine protein kinase